MRKARSGAEKYREFGGIVGETEIEWLRGMASALKGSEVFSHNDFHPGNVLRRAVLRPSGGQFGPWGG